jgi:hypothetical protein
VGKLVAVGVQKGINEERNCNSLSLVEEIEVIDEDEGRAR